jgi:hypothetical protein
MSAPLRRLAALEQELVELRAELAETGAGISRRRLMGSGLGLVGVAGALAGIGAAPTPAGAAPLVPPQPSASHEAAYFLYHPWIDVKADFDDSIPAAVGDGTTDDTAAFERALNVAAFFQGATIFVPLGSYVISRTLKVPSNTHVVGAAGGGSRASELKAATGLQGPVIENLDTTNGNFHISLRRLQVLGPAAGNPSYGAAVSFRRTTGGACTDVIIDECTVWRGGKAAIEFHVGDGQISRCTIGGNGPVSIGIIMTWADSLVWGNQITTGATPTSTAGGDGIELRPYADHNVISNNFIFWAENGVVVDNARRNVVSANRIDMNMNDGLVIKGDARFNSVTGNVFHANGMRATNTHASGVNLGGSSRYNSVTGNTSTRFGDFTPPTGGQHQPHGIRLTGTTHHNVITGNVLADNVLSGLHTEGTVGANAIHGNVIDTDDTFRVVGGAAVLDELAATPAAPADGTQATVYVKGDKLVVAYKEGATMRYKSLQLSGSGSTWAHSTTAPRISSLAGG